ncbi:hypothetical protein [Frankia sp. AiPa1]|uniref:hypothetical protein n=1 Tax=Frankia sp. AiPa1 TaxID=573492 RepID=UPI0035A82D7F
MVSAAVEVLDERGLDGLSKRAIATRIGVRRPWPGMPGACAERCFRAATAHGSSPRRVPTAGM